MTNMPPRSYAVKSLKNLHIQNKQSDDLKPLYLALRIRALQRLFKPWADLDLFYGKVTYVMDLT